jgi:hypothetical protein
MEDSFSPSSFMDSLCAPLAKISACSTSLRQSKGKRCALAKWVIATAQYVVSASARSYCFAVLVFMLSSCASLPTTAQVPVAMRCLPDEIPTAPQTLDNQELAALSDYALVLRIASERLELLAYSKQAEAIISACR